MFDSAIVNSSGTDDDSSSGDIYYGWIWYMIAYVLAGILGLALIGFCCFSTVCMGMRKQQRDQEGAIERAIREMPT